MKTKTKRRDVVLMYLAEALDILIVAICDKKEVEKECIIAVVKAIETVAPLCNVYHAYTAEHCKYFLDNVEKKSRAKMNINELKIIRDFALKEHFAENGK